MKNAVLGILFTTMLAIMLTGSGCDPYRKLAKSKVIAEKDSAAVGYYRNEQYEKAVFLFEELIPYYTGLERQEAMYYYYAYCRYFMGELVSASYYFADFAQKFPHGEHAEEAEYMAAKSYYELSDPYMLDQKYTYKAIDEIQLYLSRHPYSEKKEICNTMLTTLRERLAKKSYEQAFLYYKIGYYKSAVVAFNQMISEFPDSDFREDAQFYLFKSSVKLAEQSIDNLKEKRYLEAADYHEKFEHKFPDSKFAKDAENLNEGAKKDLELLKKKQIEQEQEALFRKIENSARIVLNSSDNDERKENYDSALENFAALSKLNSEGKWVKKAEKWMNKIENRKE